MDFFHGVERAIKHEYDPNLRQWTQTVPNVRLDSKPFSEGAMRFAFRMQDLSEKDGDYVAKMSKDARDTTAQYWVDVMMQSQAKLWAAKFNALNPPKKVDFLVAFVLELVERPGRPVCAVERFVHGPYVKYSNNDGWSDESRNTPHAFSHFTFEASSHKLLICDIQGVGDLYTDPQIHTFDGRGFGVGNTGSKGMMRFFATHRCNAICRFLGLPQMGGSGGDGATIPNSMNTVVPSLPPPSAPSPSPSPSPVSAPAAAPAANNRGSIGIKVERSPDKTHLIISLVVPNGPAAVSNQIHIGDVLLGVDGIAVSTLSVSEVVQLVVGEAGTIVVLTVFSVKTKTCIHVSLRREPAALVAAAAVVAAEEEEQQQQQQQQQRIPVEERKDGGLLLLSPRGEGKHHRSDHPHLPRGIVSPVLDVPEVSIVNNSAGAIARESDIAAVAIISAAAAAAAAAKVKTPKSDDGENSGAAAGVVRQGSNGNLLSVDCLLSPVAKKIPDKDEDEKNHDHHQRQGMLAPTSPLDIPDALPPPESSEIRRHLIIDQETTKKFESAVSSSPSSVESEFKTAEDIQPNGSAWKEQSSSEEEEGKRVLIFPDIDAATKDSSVCSDSDGSLSRAITQPPSDQDKRKSRSTSSLSSTSASTAQAPTSSSSPSSSPKTPTRKFNDEIAASHIVLEDEEEEEGGKGVAKPRPMLDRMGSNNSFNNSVENLLNPPPLPPASSSPNYFYWFVESDTEYVPMSQKEMEALEEARAKGEAECPLSSSGLVVNLRRMTAREEMNSIASPRRMRRSAWLWEVSPGFWQPCDPRLEKSLHPALGIDDGVVDIGAGMKVAVERRQQKNESSADVALPPPPPPQKGPKMQLIDSTGKASRLVFGKSNKVKIRAE